MWPILYKGDEFILFSYPLLMGAAWGIAFHQIKYYFQNQFKSLHGFNLFFIGIFLLSWLGAKIVFYLTYEAKVEPGLLDNISFWLGGGFVFYGGFIFALLFTYLFSNFYLKKTLSDFAFMVIPLSLAHAIGRIGCFLAGCCYGSETSCSLSVYLHGAYRHPVQLYEALGLILFYFWSRKCSLTQGKILKTYLIYYATLRFGLEFFRGDLIRGAWNYLSTSQWVSLAIVSLVLLNEVLVFKKIKKLF